MNNRPKGQNGMKMAKDKETIHEKAERLVAELQSKYSEAIGEARAAADTTATPAWQMNYQREIKAHNECVKNDTKTIAHVAALIVEYDTNEDHEKAIKDAVKSLVDERIRHQAWKSRTIHPFSTKAERCEELMRAVSREARDAESNAPLINRGLLDAAELIAQGWPRAEWNEATGAVVITEGDVGAKRKTAGA